MTNKFFFIIIFFILINNNVYSKNEIFIVANINDKILTNHDIKKEISYLKILNPQLDALNEKKIFIIAKNSLINETIKKNELSKYFKFDENIPLIDNIFEDFYKNLGVMNQKNFEEILFKNSTYNSKEIKEKMKTEFFWNRIILEKFKDQIKIDRKKLITKIKNSSETKKEYLLSEIFFSKDKDQSIKSKFEKIKKSIDEVGFNNTASIFSISESSNMGGKIGWIEEESLSQKIIDELKNTKINEYTNIIQFGNNFLILKIEDQKIKKVKTDEDLMLKKMVDFETNKQLNQFSSIYFNKIKVNYSINEN